MSNQPGAYEQRLFIAGRYYGAPTTTAFATTALREYAVPFVVPNGASIDRIGISVGTLGVGALYRCVIRTARPGDLQPGSVLVDGGGDLDASTTGVKEHTLTPARGLPAGLVWLCVLANASGTASLTASSSAYPDTISVGSTALATNAGGLVATLGSYTVDTAQFAGGAAITATANVPLIKVRAA